MDTNKSACSSQLSYYWNGGVISSGSVVVKSVEPMTVVSGNPAKELRKRACVHADLPVERLLHGDYKVSTQIRAIF